MTTISASHDTIERLHAEMADANLAPTWHFAPTFVSKTPKVSYRPFLWKWDDVIGYMKRAAELVTPERGAERRAMQHVNPDLKAQFGATHTIATAFQLVRAGESAPSHRHQAAAIRFVIDSKGGEVWSRVNGEPVHMETFDLLLTPSGIWHEHENRSAHDILWLDALDFPLVNMLQCSWFEPGEGQQVGAVPVELTPLIARGARPLGWRDHDASAMRWSWKETSSTLDTIGTEADSPFDGKILEYINPVTNGSTLPTLMCRVQRIEPEFRGRPQRATSSKVYFVMEGCGTSIINGQRFDWAKGDTFVVPAWAWHEHHGAGERAHLFSVTDEPVLKMLGMYRHETSDAPQAVTATFVPAQR